MERVRRDRGEGGMMAAQPDQHHQCRPRPQKRLFSRQEGEFVADFLDRYRDCPNVRDNPLFQRFRALMDSFVAKMDAGESYEREIAELSTLPALAYAEVKRIEGEKPAAKAE